MTIVLADLGTAIGELTRFRAFAFDSIATVLSRPAAW